MFRDDFFYIRNVVHAENEIGFRQHIAQIRIKLRQTAHDSDFCPFFQSSVKLEKRIDRLFPRIVYKAAGIENHDIGFA